jgi:hypothetical protein
MNDDVIKGKKHLNLSLLFFISSIIIIILMVILTSEGNYDLSKEYSLSFTIFQLLFEFACIYFLFSGLYYYRRGKGKERYSM